MFGDNFLYHAITRLPVIVLALTVHEYFHAWSAMKFGDTTAKDMGRLTLFPPAHLDLMGSIVMVVSGFQFGWAKPVPVNPFNLRNPRVADFWISFAGPLSNLGQAIIFAILFRMFYTSASPIMVDILHAGVYINIILMIFNMIPLFPLDGSHMLRNILPESAGETLDMFDRVAPFILILLVISGFLWIPLSPIVNGLYHILVGM